MRFKDNAHLLHIIEKIVSQVGRRIDEAQPIVDARLLDGSRVNAIIPPLALDGPSLSIRRFGRHVITSEEMLANQTITRSMLRFLAACVEAKTTILISGGTGSGKTTMLNALSRFIPEDERIITIEDTAELQLQQRHVVKFETRPPNLKKEGGINQRQLVRTASAHASRPHHRRRVPRRRGAGHAAGHEYRRRRLHEHDPRQLSARRVFAAGSDGADVRHRHPVARDSAATGQRHQDGGAGQPPAGRLAQDHEHRRSARR